MMVVLPRKELLKLPYVAFIPTDGRIVPIQAFFSAEEDDWYVFAHRADAELIRLADGEMISGAYLGRGIADRERDIEFPLGTLVVQHLSFSGTLAALGKLENAIHRCAAILQKYHLLWGQYSQGGSDTALLVESELEYLLLLLRSLYDLLQGVARDLCGHFRSLEDRTRKVVHDLPKSFAAVAMKRDEIAKPEDLVDRFRMPKPLAHWYYTEAPFFRELRALRDGIAHDGRRSPIVFETDWGFAVRISDEPWSRFNLWPENQRRDARLGSLRTVFAAFIAHALRAADDFARTVAGFVELPTALDKDVHFFVRSPFGHHLAHLDALVSEPWEGKVGA